MHKSDEPHAALPFSEAMANADADHSIRDRFRMKSPPSGAPLPPDEAERRRDDERIRRGERSAWPPVPHYTDTNAAGLPLYVRHDSGGGFHRGIMFTNAPLPDLMRMAGAWMMDQRPDVAMVHVEPVYGPDMDADRSWRVLVVYR